MGRLSKKSILLPPNVTCSEDGEAGFIVKGAQGEIQLRRLPLIKVILGEGGIRVTHEDESRQSQINAGTMWAHLKNAVQGASEGFIRKLEINGIGYRASMEGKTLVLALGYVHPVRYEAPLGVTLTVEKNIIVVKGADKALVGRVSADIRALKKPEPYKGKGIRYEDEVIRRKVGKKAAAAGATGA